MENLTIPARLLEERTRLKMNQTEFAARGGVGKNTQISYEKGDSYPDAAYLGAMAAEGVDVLYIITGKRDGEVSGALSDAESLLLARYRQGSAVLRGYLQEVGGTQDAKGNTVAIGGDVGQAVAGDATFSAPVSFGGRAKKAPPPK